MVALRRHTHAVWWWNSSRSARNWEGISPYVFCTAFRVLLVF